MAPCWSPKTATARSGGSPIPAVERGAPRRQGEMLRLAGLVSRFREISYDIKHGKLLRPLRADSLLVVSKWKLRSPSPDPSPSNNFLPFGVPTLSGNTVCN